VGLTLQEIRESLPDRLRDSTSDDPAAGELMNIFIQSGADLFAGQEVGTPTVHLGQTSVLAQQPEFSSGEQLKSLIELTERQDLLAGALGERTHAGGLKITIGGENTVKELSDFTLVTSEYSVAGLKGVIGVIGPTRMHYEKVMAIVDYTSSLISEILSA
jgi:heat-inducible transcriptional repressor